MVVLKSSVLFVDNKIGRRTKQFFSLIQKGQLSKQVCRKNKIKQNKVYLKHSPAGRVFYISLMFSNARRVLSRVIHSLGRLLYLKGQCHEDFGILGQFCAKILTLRLSG